MKPNGLFHIIVFLIILNTLIPGFFVNAAPEKQISSPEIKAQSLLEQMTPEERVGQLFLTVFDGSNVGDETQIFNLIVNYQIGGVILLASNDNISSGDDILKNIVLMNRELQMNSWSASLQTINSVQTGQYYQPQYIPLFIGVSQEGDGYPYDQILSGVTPLPNAMALGATWNPELVMKSGEIVGNELSLLGVNLLLGPALDVLETPRAEKIADLGTRTFGSDPFWVSLLGSAYIRGIHQGSNNKIAVIAKHFPGNGGADRSAEEEVATVRKSLERLKSYDLVPFFSVTGNALTQESTADGLLASHIRYQGFQENIRATTRPVSFDPQAFNLLMHLEPLESWRTSGGLVICDNLGSQAVRQFYQLTGQTYDVRRVALNAFLAGNDVLFLGKITTNEEPDQYKSVIRVLDFFTQKYREDQAFAQQVDASVLRILTLKYKLYPNFILEDVLPKLDEVDLVGKSSQFNFEVAQQAVTLISPSVAELADTVAEPPKPGDRIVFITDVRMTRQCSNCTLQPALNVDAFEQAVKRLYGPQAGGIVWPANLVSYTFEDLQKMLDKDPNAPPLEDAINHSEWVVFSLMNMSEEIPSSLSLRRFLSERPDLIQKRKLIVFAFNAPYYLDATNISKLDAYYGMYSKNPFFVEVAARILFKELIPRGALPVSVPGVGYDIISATSPNPDQIIPIFLDFPPSNISTPTSQITPEPTPMLSFLSGALIPIRTGIILDHNGYPVPDGTPVQFISSVGGESSFPQSATTVGGIGRTTIKVSIPGTWEIRVESEPAKQSEKIRFDVPTEAGELPTFTPTELPTLIPTITPSPVMEEVDALPVEPITPSHPNISDWFTALLISLSMGLLTYRLSAFIGQIRWGMRGGILAFIGGMIAYTYIVLSMPGSSALYQKLSIWGIILITLFGSAIGVLTTWGWKSIRVDNLRND